MSTASLPYDLTDAIANAGTPAARARVIFAFISELYDTVGWVLASKSSTELTSLQHVVDEAQSHQGRSDDPQPTTVTTTTEFVAI